MDFVLEFFFVWEVNVVHKKSFDGNAKAKLIREGRHTGYAILPLR
jgi:hypothetical protein